MQRVAVGDVICFELAYDQTVDQAITSGAQVMMVQSNNATYGGTGQIEQQFAITRARAMETRREIAVATTNSVSGFIDRDGRVVLAFGPVHPRRPRGQRCRCASSITPGVRYGAWVDRGLAGLAVLFCWPAGRPLRRPRRTASGSAYWPGRARVRQDG